MTKKTFSMNVTAQEAITVLEHRGEKQREVINNLLWRILKNNYESDDIEKMTSHVIDLVLEHKMTCVELCQTKQKEEDYEGS